MATWEQYVPDNRPYRPLQSRFRKTYRSQVFLFARIPGSRRSDCVHHRRHRGAAYCRSSAGRPLLSSAPTKNVNQSQMCDHIHHRTDIQCIESYDRTHIGVPKSSGCARVNRIQLTINDLILQAAHADLSRNPPEGRKEGGSDKLVPGESEIRRNRQISLSI